MNKNIYIPKTLVLPLPNDTLGKREGSLVYVKLYKFHPIIGFIVEHPLFERLRNINQSNLQLIRVTRSNKITRHLHCMNASLLIVHFIEDVLKNDLLNGNLIYKASESFDEIYGSSKNDESVKSKLNTNFLALVIAMLLHDVGHLPGSHDTEDIYKCKIKLSHEERSCLIARYILEQYIDSENNVSFISGKLDETIINKVCSMINPSKYEEENLFTSIISNIDSAYDLDKVEYITREWIEYLHDIIQCGVNRKFVKDELDEDSSTFLSRYSVLNAYFSARISPDSKSLCFLSDLHLEIYNTFKRREILFNEFYRNDDVEGSCYEYYNFLNGIIKDEMIPIINKFDEDLKLLKFFRERGNKKIKMSNYDKFIKWDDNYLSELFYDYLINPTSEFFSSINENNSTVSFYNSGEKEEIKQYYKKGLDRVKKRDQQKIEKIILYNKKNEYFPITRVLKQEKLIMLKEKLLKN